MSDIADRYRRLCGDFAAEVVQVSPERWGAPSPYDDWTARDVVVHLVDVHSMFLRLVGRSVERTRHVDDDPAGAPREAVAAVQADLDDPDRASAEFDGYFGRMTFEGAVDRFVCFDLAIHGWNLARAAGLDETIASGELTRLRADAEAFGEALHQSGVCGPRVAVAADADDQTKRLALLGRCV